MTKHHPLIKIAEMAIDFTEADPEIGAKIEGEVKTIFNRYPSEKDNLLKIWNDLVRSTRNHKRENPGVPLAIEETLIDLLRRQSI